MKELFRDLIECLASETGHYRKLILLAEKQKELLVAGNVASLNENTRLEEKEVFALGPLAAQRNELLSRIAQANQVKKISLEKALERCPGEHAAELQKVIKDLERTVKGLDELNQSNGNLLHNALTFANFTLRIIDNTGKKKIYSPQGTIEEVKQSVVNRIV